MGLLTSWARGHAELSGCREDGVAEWHRVGDRGGAASWESDS